MTAGRWPLVEGMTGAEVRAAVARIARPTPLLRADALTEELSVETWVKAECLQVTGSFKVRGAATRLTALTESERARGVIACSSGNHGRAVAHVAALLGIPATIYAPEWVDPVKLEGIRRAGATLELVGDTFDAAELAAESAAAESGRVYVSAYDDPWVISGQGTLAGEISEQLGAAPGTLIAPLSGGGLIGGIAAALLDAPTRIVAVSAARAAVMAESVRAGEPVVLPEEPTIASALAGGIGSDNRHSFALVRKLVQVHARVSEADIRAAIAYSARGLRLVVEGGGAVGLAALRAGAIEAADLRPPVVVVLSGGNLDPCVLADVLRSG